MHDPMTVSHEIRYPWRKYPKSKQKPLLSDYRAPFITIWHVDPCKDGTDDSCGWFKRSRHGNPKVLEKIIKRFDQDWDREFKSDSGKTYHLGLFYPQNAGLGMPNMGVSSIALWLFFLAALEHFDGKNAREKAAMFCQKNLFEILIFAENPTDSIRDSIARVWGCEAKRDERIREIASCIYGWILRETTPWYRHPRWHIHHWKIQIHPLQSFKRWAFSRCCKCGGGFKWGASVVSNQWDSSGPSWTGEKHVMHDNCCGCCVTDSPTVESPTPPATA